MNKFFTNLLELLTELPRILQFAFYMLIIIAGFKFWFWIQAPPKYVETSFTGFMGSSKVDQVVTSRGATANYTAFINDIEYESLNEVQKAIKETKSRNRDKVREKVALCIYETEFVFGFSNRNKMIENFTVENSTKLQHKAPSIIAVNTLKSQELIGPRVDDKIAAIERCASYQAKTLQCDKNCSKLRISEWLKEDKVLVDHLRQGILTGGEIALANVNNDPKKIETIKTNTKILLTSLETSTEYDADTGDFSMPNDSVSNTELNMSESLTPVANTSGSYPNVVLLMTFSSIATINAEGTKWIWPFTTDKGFGLKRDLMVVGYGSELPLYLINSGNDSHKTINLPIPHQLYTDRNKQAIFFTEEGDFDELEKFARSKNQSILGYLNSTLMNNFRNSIEKHENYARSEAMNILSRRFMLQNKTLVLFDNISPGQRILNKFANYVDGY